MDGYGEFRKALESLLNAQSMENKSDTPDFILAKYLIDCLCVFDYAVRARSRWYYEMPREIKSGELSQIAIGGHSLEDIKLMREEVECEAKKAEIKVVPKS